MLGLRDGDDFCYVLFWGKFSLQTVLGVDYVAVFAVVAFDVCDGAVERDVEFLLTWIVPVLFEVSHLLVRLFAVLSEAFVHVEEGEGGIAVSVVDLVLAFASIEVVVSLHEEEEVV